MKTIKETFYIFENNKPENDDSVSLKMGYFIWTWKGKMYNILIYIHTCIYTSRQHVRVFVKCRNKFWNKDNCERVRWGRVIPWWLFASHLRILPIYSKEMVRKTWYIYVFYHYHWNPVAFVFVFYFGLVICEDVSCTLSNMLNTTKKCNRCTQRNLKRKLLMYK